MRNLQVRPVELSRGEKRALQMRALQHCACQRCLPKVCSSQIRLAELRTVQMDRCLLSLLVRAADQTSYGTRERQPPQVRAPQVCAAQVESQTLTLALIIPVYRAASA